jgi:hypothetical protein
VDDDDPVVVVVVVVRWWAVVLLLLDRSMVPDGKFLHCPPHEGRSKWHHCCCDESSNPHGNGVGAIHRMSTWLEEEDDERMTVMMMMMIVVEIINLGYDSITEYCVTLMDWERRWVEMMKVVVWIDSQQQQPQ